MHALGSFQPEVTPSRQRIPGFQAPIADSPNEHSNSSPVTPGSSITSYLPIPYSAGTFLHSNGGSPDPAPEFAAFSIAGRWFQPRCRPTARSILEWAVPQPAGCMVKTNQPLYDPLLQRRFAESEVHPCLNALASEHDAARRESGTLEQHAVSYILFIGGFSLTDREVRSSLRLTLCPYSPLWHGRPGFQRHLSKVEVIVTRNHGADAGVIAGWKRKSPQLKMLSLAFTGYDDVDLACCKQNHLAAYYCPDYSTTSVAEHTIALTMAVFRRIPRGDANVRSGKFDTGGVQPGTELAGKTVGILGTGTIGLASARLFRAFGCEIIGWSRRHRADFANIGGRYHDRSEVLQRSDLVVLHLALNNETRCIIDGSALRQMKRSAVLVNTARAGLVDTAALVSALKRGLIAGAGLDVYDDEHALLGQPRHPLLKAPNVVLSPHCGFKTHEALTRLTHMAIVNVGRWRRGDLTNCLVSASS